MTCAFCGKPTTPWFTLPAACRPSGLMPAPDDSETATAASHATAGDFQRAWFQIVLSPLDLGDSVRIRLPVLLRCGDSQPSAK
jgi:hypothetical protein